MSAIFGRFSKSSEAVLIEAQRIAEQLHRPVQSDMVLLAVLAHGASPASDLLKRMGASYTKLFEQLMPLPGPDEQKLPGQSKEMQLLLEESIKVAGRLGFNMVEIEHMIYVVAHNDAYLGHAVLNKAGVDTVQLANRIGEWLFGIAAVAGTPFRQPKNQNQGQGEERATSQGGEDESELEKYAVDITEMAREGRLDPVIGRDKELDQLIHILLRRRKNNPLLIGEPGVGKTALVDGLAQRIVDKKIPQPLIGRRVLNLDLSLMVAGTMYRGQFEERLKNVLAEIVEEGDCILFIDEIHTISGTGSSEGGFDAANILKPALARGELSLIGATTYEEYRRHIRKDKALDRRFQTITVAEPSSSEAIAMLKGMKSVLEQHHNVRISDKAIRSAVELSTRYIHERFLPDKAIDILDEAATYHAQQPVEKDDEAGSIQNEIAEVSAEKNQIVENAIDPEEWDMARLLNEKEELLREKLSLVQKKKRPKTPRTEVTAAEVSRVIAARSGLPLSQIEQTLEPLSLRRIQTVLKKHILGQDAAIEKISQALMRAELGLQPSKKPLGSFLLVGPTGVGKTETARILAEQIFGDRSALIKIDMSEYMERHSVSNLIGAPAGYVGFEQGGNLTEQVWRRPYSVVLFDEVEKAHPDVFNVLLQILEDGTLTDNTGRVTSFEHCIIILTSNIGLENFNQAAKIGFAAGRGESEIAKSEQKQEELEDHIQHEINDYFRPELLGRMSGIVFYRPLSEKVVERLVLNRLGDLKTKLRTRTFKLSHTPAAVHAIVKKYDPEAGARSIDRIFLREVEPLVIEQLLQDADHHELLLDSKDDKLVITQKK